MSTRTNDEELVDFCAFVSHPSQSLRESVVLWATASNTQVQCTTYEYGAPMLEQRGLRAFPGKTAAEVLSGFCQAVILPFMLRRDAAAIVCGMAQQFFRAFDGNSGFVREQLPLGIQGLKQVDWVKHNEELAAIRQRHQERKDQHVFYKANFHGSFLKDGLEGKEYLCIGKRDEAIVCIDDSMKAANIVKYSVHTFEDDVNHGPRFSWHVFLKVDHQAFVNSNFHDSAVPTQDMGTLLMLAMKLFSEAKTFVENRVGRDEMIVLKETIWRKEFYEKSTVSMVNTTAVTESPNPRSQNLPESQDNNSAAPSAQHSKPKAHSRSSSHISSTSSSSTTSDTMETPQVTEMMADSDPMPAKKKKANKKNNGRRKKAIQRQGQPLTNANTNADENAEVPTASQQGLPINPSVPESLPNVQSTAKSSKDAEPTSSKNIITLEDDMTALKMPDPPIVPQRPTASSSAQQQNPSNTGAQRLKDKFGAPGGVSIAPPSVSNTYRLPSLPTTPPALPTQPQYTQEKNPVTHSPASVFGNFSQKRIGDISGKIDPVEISKSNTSNSFATKSTQSRTILPRGDHPLRNSFIPSPAGSQTDEQPEVEHESQRTGKEVLRNTESYNAVQDRIPVPVAAPKPFKFDSSHPELKCRKPDCRAMTSCWDHAVVICPACGTDSLVRYCKKQHLFDDIQRHWIKECGTQEVVGMIDRSTIRAYQIPGRAYLAPAGQNANMLERHRQAVYRATGPEDYSIFADLDEIEASIAEPTPAQWNAVRGTGKLVAQLTFVDDGNWACEAHQFQHHLGRALAVGAPMAADSCLTALGMIRAALVKKGAWREEVLTYLCMQLPGEWGGFRVPSTYYNVAEANAVWAISRALPSM